MQLDDRTINYQSHPHIELNQAEIGDIHCGTWKKYPRHIRATQAIDLKYRQNGDCTGEPIEKEVPPTQATAVPENDQPALNQSTRQQVLAELRSTHLNNIRRNLEHRLQVAREKGDENLIRLLSAELEQID